MSEKGEWVGGLAQWEIDGTVYLSIAFTWELDRAYSIALWARSLGKRVIAGGPALFLVKMQHVLADVAEIASHYPEAVTKHNPMATFASRGCPVGCGFCIVPAMEGREFTLIPDFTPRPVLCDNNLSALPADYQQHIIDRYYGANVPLLDANSGFEPETFTPEVYERWKPLINASGGPWRFAYDETKERDEVLRVMNMLKKEPQKRKRVYVLIGNEPFDACMRRIQEVIDGGCEPHVQPVMKLAALEKRPWVRKDLGWEDEAQRRGIVLTPRHKSLTPGEQLLRDIARWANGWVWKKAPFDDYDRSMKSKRPAKEDEKMQTGGLQQLLCI